MYIGLQLGAFNAPKYVQCTVKHQEVAVSRRRCLKSAEDHHSSLKNIYTTEGCSICWLGSQVQCAVGSSIMSMHGERHDSRHR